MSVVDGRRNRRVKLFGVLVAALVLAGCVSSSSSSSSDATAAPQLSSTTSARQSVQTPSQAAVSEELAEVEGWRALPVCGTGPIGFEVDEALSSVGWVASAQLDRASVGLDSDIASILALEALLPAEYVVANGFRTEAEQIEIRDAISYYRESFFQTELGSLRWDHPDISTGLVRTGLKRFAVTHTEAGASTILPMIDRAYAEAKQAGVEIDVEAVQVERSMEDLEGLMQSLTTRLPDWWLQIDTRVNAVTVDFGFMEESDEQRWPFEDVPEGVCRLTGDPIGDFGPQPGGGEGWRLIAITDSAGEGPVPTATGTDELVQLWRDLGVPDDLPVVDFSNEIVAVFLELRGFPPACNRVIFDGVDFGETEVSGRPRHLEPVGLEGCLAIGLPRSFVVAIERSLLPNGAFTLRRDVEPRSYDIEQEQVRLDLSTLDSEQ